MHSAKYTCIDMANLMTAMQGKKQIQRATPFVGYDELKNKKKLCDKQVVLRVNLGKPSCTLR